MKKHILLIAVFICIAMLTQAQETKTRRQDLRIMANNLIGNNQFNFMEWLYYYDYYDMYDYGYFPYPDFQFNKKNYGIGYLVGSEKSAMRINIGFNFMSQKNNKNTDSYNGNISELSKLKYTQSYLFAGLGYQRDWMFEKCNVYTGVDAKFSYSSFSESYTITNNTYDPPHATDYLMKNYTSGIGMGPFIGAGYFLTPKLSISIETSLDYCYEFIVSQNRANSNYAAVEEHKTEDARNTFKFTPLSAISVNVHF